MGGSVGGWGAKVLLEDGVLGKPRPSQLCLKGLKWVMWHLRCHWKIRLLHGALRNRSSLVSGGLTVMYGRVAGSPLVVILMLRM